MKKRLQYTLAGSISLLLSTSCFAGHHQHDGKEVIMKNLETGKVIGSVMVNSYDDDGVVFTPHLSGLTPGIHGFHVHQNGNCASSMKNGKKVLGGAAGGHFDPEDTNAHRTPWSEKGHEGDLPVLYVDEQGNATQPVFAPELEIEDIEERALMIHAGGDNYSDSPKKLGGGGERVACGIINK